MFYRVRKTWEDKSSQIGTFTVLENAILMVDANPGYAVFDENGSQIYPQNHPQNEENEEKIVKE